METILLFIYRYLYYIIVFYYCVYLMYNMNERKIIILFDVDGTLTPARKKIESQMVTCLQKLSNVHNLHLGIVGGSDLSKQTEQLCEDNLYLFEWRFSENGLLGYHKNTCIHKRSFVEAIGEEHFKMFINICLSVLSETNCPIKRGTFIEYRNGMLNISPVGRACSQEERDEFEEYDKSHNIRKIMIKNIKNKWKKYLDENNLDLLKIQFSIGGQISFDIFPEGWDKTYCLQFIVDKYDKIYFFGDKTHEGGNDCEIYNDPRVIGHHVNSYEDTIRILNKLF
jgi:phosphomannomutase